MQPDGSFGFALRDDKAVLEGSEPDQDSAAPDLDPCLIRHFDSPHSCNPTEIAEARRADLPGLRPGGLAAGRQLLAAKRLDTARCLACATSLALLLVRGSKPVSPLLQQLPKSNDLNVAGAASNKDESDLLGIFRRRDLVSSLPTRQINHRLSVLQPSGPT